MIQVRDVPEKTHAVLKARAAMEGMSLSDYLKRELEKLASQPSLREWLESASKLKPIRSAPSAARLVRQLRDAR